MAASRIAEYSSDVGEELSSVRNAARLLRAFTPADPGAEVGISDLARRLDLGTSTVHRIVTTLVSERLLERGTRPGKYRLGLAMYEIGTQVSEHVDLHQAALPVLATLRHTTGEMVHIAVLDGLEVVYVERLESHHLMPVFRAVGHRLLAHGTSSGKVLLAALPPQELDRRLAATRLRRVTPRTIVDRDALRAELDLVAERGWAENVEESHVGVSSVGAPIRGANGEVLASVSVVGASTRMTTPTRRRMVEQVVAAAELMSTRLGYRR
jgi:IclR family transcriptional regulator, KDG regulon repressor